MTSPTGPGTSSSSPGDAVAALVAEGRFHEAADRVRELRLCLLRAAEGFATIADRLDRMGQHPGDVPPWTD